MDGRNDPDPDGGAGVAGDGLHGHAQRISLLGAAGSRSASQGPAGWPFILLSWSARRSFEGDLARWPGGLPVHQAIGTSPFHLAERWRRRGDDLNRTTRLFAIRH